HEHRQRAEAGERALHQVRADEGVDPQEVHPRNRADAEGTGLVARRAHRAPARDDSQRPPPCRAAAGRRAARRTRRTRHVNVHDGPIPRRRIVCPRMLASMENRVRRWLYGRDLAVWYAPEYRWPLSALEARTGFQPRRAA